jgi:hypothetical protein
MKPLTNHLLVAIALAFAIAVAVIGLFLARSSPTTSAVTISPPPSLLPPFPNLESLPFFVTNHQHHQVLLGRAEVQVVTNGSWQTVSKKETKLFDHNKVEDDDWGMVEAEAYKVIWLDPPGCRRWRVCLTYLPEGHGLNGLLLRAQTAWVTHTTPTMRGRVFSGQQRQTITAEISQ